MREFISIVNWVASPRQRRVLLPNRPCGDHERDMHPTRRIACLPAAAKVWIVFAALLGVATPAFATQSATMSTNFPAVVKVGDTFSATLTITSTSTPPDDTDISVVTNIQLVPLCGQVDANGVCTLVDAGVFAISNAQGRASTPSVPNACAGIVFPRLWSTGCTRSWRVPRFAIDPNDIWIGADTFSTQCIIDFNVAVLTVAPHDADPAAPGTQTLQVGSADLQGYDSPGHTGIASGTNSTTFNAREMFVIGDVEPHAVGNIVNFWGAQWWQNNPMSGFVSSGVGAFKGYASASTGPAGACGPAAQATARSHPTRSRLT